MNTLRFAILFAAALVAGMFSVDAQTLLTPYIQVNNGAWQVTSTVTVNGGDYVSMGPQNLSGGTFAWSGPGGFTATTRGIYGVPLTAPSEVFNFTYTDPTGAVSTLTFTVTVNGTPLIPWIMVNNGPWQQIGSAAVNLGDVVNLGPQNLTGGTYVWSGNGLNATGRVAYSVPLTSPSNIFTLTYTNTAEIVSTETFTIAVNPTPITPWFQVNNGAWQQVSTVTVNPGDTVSLGPWPNGSPNDPNWSWAGPNGFSASTRAVYNVPLLAGSNVYLATYTNAAKVESHLPLTVTVAGYSVELSWFAPVSQTDPVVSYHVYRATGSGSYALLGNAENIAYTDTTVAEGLTYNYEVKSVDVAGVESIASNLYAAVIP